MINKNCPSRSSVKFNFFFLLTLLFCFTALGAQKESGSLDTDLAPFEMIKLLGYFEVELIAGEQERIEVKSHGVNPERISISQQNRTLKVSTLRPFMDDDIEIEITIYYRTLTSLVAGAGAQIESDDIIKTEEFYLNGGSGSEVFLEFETRKLEVQAGEGAHLTLKGSTDELRAGANTGGIFDGHRLSSQNARLRAGTGGEVSANVSSSLDAKANTGGIIRYQGNPEEVNVRTILGGEIKALNR